MKHLSLFLLVLIVSAAMILSHVPRKAIAHEHGVIESVANLIPVELTDRNAVEVEGLRMEIVQPELVLRIPENRLGVGISGTLNVRIIIKPPNRLAFREYSSVVPELVDPDGQVLQWQQVPDFGEEGRCVGGGLTNEAGDYAIINRLYWRNNKLTLGFVGVTMGSNLRLFENLKPGTYRLRFTYKSCGERLPCLNPPVTKESWGVKPLETGQCATEFVNLRLVY